MPFLKLSSMHGLDVNDLAVDILGEIFRQDNNGNFINLIKFRSKLYDELETINENNLFFAYQSFLRTVSDTHIARLYAELDPNGFKIQRNIKESLPNENLGIRKNILGTMIYVLNYETNDHLPYIYLEDFEKEFLTRVIEKLSTRELLNIIYLILLDVKEYRKEITLTDTVYLFKKYYGIESVIQNGDEFDIVPSKSTIEEYELQNIYDEVIKKIKLKIFTDYYSKGKLSIEQSKSLIDTINDITYDLLFTGQNNTSYYNYLYKHLHINKEEYNNKFKSKLEYLVKLVHCEIKNYFFAKD
ncbi:hypothetical protein [Rosettibacter firmus]|uniref:hypothetical protein n=1 Tax=Rosettibacter firmus TaxID=3111522 RepID=UPI00336C0144